MINRMNQINQMDERLYRETFSKLQASAESKEEVFQKMKNQKNQKRIPKLLRVSGIAAAMTVALAVTASAVNLATDGMLFHIVMNDGFHMTLEDESGNQVEAYKINADTELRDGRLFLLLGNPEKDEKYSEIDITDEILSQGSYTHTFERDGVDVCVEVAGTLEDNHINIQTEMQMDDGITYSFDSDQIPEGEYAISQNPDFKQKSTISVTDDDPKTDGNIQEGEYHITAATSTSSAASNVK